MSMGPPPAALQRVPIRETARAAYRTVFGQLDQLARAALLPFLLNTVLAAPTLLAAGNPILFVVMLLLTLVPYTLFGVTWHRLTLLGQPSAPAPSPKPAMKVTSTGKSTVTCNRIAIRRKAVPRCRNSVSVMRSR